MDERKNRKFLWSYSAGGFGKNLAYGLTANYSLYYFNKVLGISATFVGVLLMAARIFDAFNDPIMGVVTERTRSRWGKLKPWLLAGCILNSLVLVAMFSVPQSITGSRLKVYISVAYLLCGITYTLGDIPYWSVIPAVTRPGVERERMAVFSRTCAGFGAALPIMVVMVLIPILGGGSTNECYRLGFGWLSVIVAAIYLVSTILMMKFMPREENLEEKNVSVREMFSSFLKNDQILALGLVLTLFNTAVYLSTNIALYVFTYDVRSEAHYTIFMVVTVLVQFVTMVGIYPALRRKLSNRALYAVGCCIGLLAFVIFSLLIPAKSVTLGKLMFPGAMIGLSNGFGYVLNTILIADAVDYGERKTGQRQDSMVSSVQTLIVKLSSAVAVLIAGIGLDVSGIDDSLAVQTPEALAGVRCILGIPGLVLMALALLVLWKKKSIGKEL